MKLNCKINIFRAGATWEASDIYACRDVIKLSLRQKKTKKTMYLNKTES